MDERSTTRPHILEDGEAVADVTVDGSRALLVFVDGESAGEFAERVPIVSGRPVAVSSAEISETCARHGLALVALYGFVEPEDLSVVSVELLPEIFGEEV